MESQTDNQENKQENKELHELIFINHSEINSYPPNPIKYQNFYNCKQEIFILNPGDCLFIPKYWAHWVFSYPEKYTIYGENSGNFTFHYNIACSYPTFQSIQDNSDIFSTNKPMKIKLDKKDADFLNCDLFDIINDSDENKYNYISSEENTLNNIIKTSSNKKTRDKKNFTDIFNIYKTKHYNIYLGQNEELYKNNIYDFTVPAFWGTCFKESRILPMMWFSLHKDDNYIESGLHHDNSNNLLIQIKGTKLVRLFSPKYVYNGNLYMKNFNEKIIFEK